MRLSVYDDDKIRMSIILTIFSPFLGTTAREPWLVCGMMDYFNHAKSVRIVDVLVKVQEPHDIFIFNKLLEWVSTSKRAQAFELFWHIVKKQPSWLYKVASHQFFKEMLRVLKVKFCSLTIFNGIQKAIILPFTQCRRSRTSSPQ